MKNRFLILLVLMVVAVSVGFSQRVHYDFAQDTLTNVDTAYFLFPDEFRSTPGQSAGTFNQWYQIQQTNTSGTSTTRCAIEVSNFANQDDWVETGDTLALSGTSRGLLINSDLNARYVRVKVRQSSNPGVTRVDAAVRTQKN